MKRVCCAVTTLVLVAGMLLNPRPPARAQILNTILTSKPPVASPPSNFAYVASSVTGCFATSGAGGICAYALHVNPTAGHLLVVMAVWADSGTQTFAVSSSPSCTWTPLGTKKTGVGSLAGYSGEMFYCSAAGGATTITGQTNTSSAFAAWESTEYSFTGTLATDGTPQYSNTAASGGTATVSGLTTSNASDLIWAACLAVDSACSAGAGYTGRNDAAGACEYNGSSCTATNFNFLSNTGSIVEDKVNVAAGAQSATFGTGTTDNVILGLAGF